MDKLEHLQTLNRQWMDNRPIIAQTNADVQFVLRLLQQEVQEAIEADENELPQELSDILLFTLTAFNAVDADAFEETLTKIAFNTARYKEPLLDGSLSYDEARTRVKQGEGDIKKDFY